MPAIEIVIETEFPPGPSGSIEYFVFVQVDYVI